MLTRTDTPTEDIATLMAQMGSNAKAASGPLSIASAERKHAALSAMAEAILRHMDDILSAAALQQLLKHR